MRVRATSGDVAVVVVVLALVLFGLFLQPQVINITCSIGSDPDTSGCGFEVVHQVPNAISWINVAVAGTILVAWLWFRRGSDRYQ